MELVILVLFCAWKPLAIVFKYTHRFRMQWKCCGHTILKHVRTNNTSATHWIWYRTLLRFLTLLSLTTYVNCYWYLVPQMPWTMKVKHRKALSSYYRLDLGYKLVKWLTQSHSSLQQVTQRQKACSNPYAHAQSIGLLSAQREQYKVGVSILLPTNAQAFYTSFYFK